MSTVLRAFPSAAVLISGVFMSIAASALDSTAGALDYIVHAERTIDRPAAQIWPLLFRPAHWTTGRRYERITGDPGREGERVKVISTGLESSDQYHFTQVVKVIPDRLYTVKAFSKEGGSYGLEFKGFEGLTLVECGKSTKVTFYANLEMRSPSLSRDEVLRMQTDAERRWAQNLERLEALVTSAKQP